MKVRYFYILLLTISSYISEAQDLTNNLKVWSGIGVTFKVNKKLNAKVSQLFAFNVSPGTYSFSQTKLALSYKIKRRVSIEGGYVRGLFNDSNKLRRQGATSGWFNTLAVDRLYGNISLKHNLAKRLTLKHKVEFQYFFPDLDKYKTRSIYTAKSSYNVRRSSLAPFFEGQLYYYQGGEISSGFKRLRLKTGGSFKPVRRSSAKLTFYYLYQNEFSTEILSDNDYTVFGVNVSFKIK